MKSRFSTCHLAVRKPKTEKTNHVSVAAQILMLDYNVVHVKTEAIA